jgi:hypothetical protein
MKTKLQPPSNTHEEPYTNQSLQHHQQYQQSSDIKELNNMMKGLFEPMETMLNLLTTMLTNLK